MVEQNDSHHSYYTKGSEEVAKETPLTLKKLEKRRNLTRNSERLVIVLVGLPARGKSFIARKLVNFLLWNGHKCKIFNVGRYRRQAVAALQIEQGKKAPAEGVCAADFFDSKNEEAAKLREMSAEVALRDMLRWIDNEEDDEDHMHSDSFSTGAGVGGGGHSRRASDVSAITSVDVLESKVESDRIAIFDATNSTNKRRSWILEECTSPAKRAGKPTGVVFVESICDDEELLRENYRFKITSSPDYDGMNQEDALNDLLIRVKKYEENYETITDDSQSYIKIFNLSTKLLVNHIYGRMAKIIVPALMAWNVGTRPIFLTRPGKTHHNVTTDEEDYVWRIDAMNVLDVSGHSSAVNSVNRKVKGEKLGSTGLEFRRELEEFMMHEGLLFMQRQKEIARHFSLETGTSRSGLSRFLGEESMDHGSELPFPCTILTSTMPRAAETVMWEQHPFPVTTISNLNPLDKGDFAGMELDEISSSDPDWYARLSADPYCTRFPGGESYRDLIKRLESVIIDMEQQTGPVLVVSHVSVLQSLIAYFRQSPISQCMSIEVPLHTVIKFTPSRGGGWMESRHPLLPEESDEKMVPVMSESELSALSCSEHVAASPIWGDHVAPKRANSNS